MRLNNEVLALCSGCKACEEICPNGCLTISDERADFFERIVDLDICVECGLCDKVCPHLNPPRLKKPEEGFNAFCNAYAVCKRSSSGGIASTIYRTYLKKGVNCVGVRFDESMKLSYRLIKNEDEIYRFAGSRYVYSDMSEIFKHIRKKIELQEQVLFIGMPCHVAGLINAVGDVDNLITVDITCDCLPMPYFFREHIKHIESVTGEKIFDARFREKNNEFGLTAKNASERTVYRKDGYRDEYMLAFRKEVICCSACYECPYATDKRCSDMTIMDCSIPDGKKMHIKPFFRASQVLINSDKGRLLWKTLIDENSISYESYPIEDMVKAEKRMRYPSIHRRENRKLLFLMRFLSFENAVKILYPFSMLFKDLIEKE